MSPTGLHPAGAGVFLLTITMLVSVSVLQEDLREVSEAPTHCT